MRQARKKVWEEKRKNRREHERRNIILNMEPD